MPMEYKVTITESLVLGVLCSADSPGEALEQVRDEYKQQKHVLSADHFCQVNFDVEELQ